MKNLIAAVLLVSAIYAGAVSSSVSGGRKPVARTLDANGNPVMFNDDKPWKVFENGANAGSGNNFETQVTDEGSVAPKVGILHKICIESGTPGTSWALVWDTSAQTTIGTVAASQALYGRRLFPVLYLGTNYSFICTPDINALFTAGLRTVNQATAINTYIYWRGLGDRQ